MFSSGRQFFINGVSSSLLSGHQMGVVGCQIVIVGCQNGDMWHLCGAVSHPECGHEAINVITIMVVYLSL